MNPYEILLRFDENGKYKGGHTIRFDPVSRQAQEPLPIGTDQTFPWPDEVKAINQGIAARVSELESLINDGNAQRMALQSEKDAAEKAFSDYKTQALAVASAISVAVNDPATDTDSAVTAILHEATKDERTKQREALKAQRAELEKQLAALV